MAGVILVAAKKVEKKYLFAVGCMIWLLFYAGVLTADAKYPWIAYLLACVLGAPLFTHLLFANDFVRNWPVNCFGSTDIVCK
jgi:hypothetical protein